ncbi:exo-rhamnogalacturonan lyase family protein [Paenibacillus tarimensis]|uniref:exo-rhamnogalacturonan lyase family protein n=1 Tax=Paenibacillus tarimensis TaxID=416012 RepID=UPI001F448EB3|nr:hypothetical protein [Paenibacillus tarimensis]MCF2946257.1 hypothetical protein [Paenibacillus tarimensis]
MTIRTAGTNTDPVTGPGTGAALSWLGGHRPPAAAGVTWGVPWKRGELQRSDQLGLRGSASEEEPASGCGNVPVQSWPLAYWPDGSVKWTAHAAVFAPEQAAHDYRIVRTDEHEQPAACASKVTVTESTTEVVVDTGAIRCCLPRRGPYIIREIIRSMEGTQVCAGGKLTGIREVQKREPDGRTVREEQMTSEVELLQLEQPGPLRAVIRVSGRHVTAGGRRWLPFQLRLYFYAGLEQIRIVHTFVYDGNPHQDFIRGLGLEFAVPMRGPCYNRHVRFAGETGWFAESPKGLMMFRLNPPYDELYREQTAGRSIELLPDRDADFLLMMDNAAVWNDYKLSQLTPDSYTMKKRTGEGCSWIKASSGSRARGLVYAGGEGGGIAAGLRYFWQKAPSALEVAGAAGSTASITVWLWSRDAEPMDLRHYDTETHVASAYEGAEEMRSTPYGIANTNECTLWCLGETPAAQELDHMADLLESPPLLVCKPEHYHASGSLGVWSLPDRSTRVKAHLEDTLTGLYSFYKDEVERRGWYGFWDYGDVMHSYDPIRHTWRYDIGGCAWQNTELAPNMWLWYMFLRTGRKDIFRFAEAMTRHTSEVDVYHIGEYAGLGSRHNVLHWGCGCKEARIAMAGLHRYYFYLTADERISDRMDAVRDADYATVTLDPMRAYYPKDHYPTHTRSGPDWSAFCSNWLVQWERYEDNAYRDKMLRGIDCLKRMPDRLLTGPVFGYDPKTGELHHMGDENWGHHLMICMGGAQVWIEMAELLNDPEWCDMTAEYGAFYTLPPERKAELTDGRIQGVDWNIPMLATSMMAYAAVRRDDQQLAREAWDLLLQGGDHWFIAGPPEPLEVPGREYMKRMVEVPGISTNTVSQWSINVIVCLELIGRWLDNGQE